MVNNGKAFEYEFAKQCEKVTEIQLTRLHDNVNRFKDINNPCDFILYYYPNVFYLELKSTKGKSFPFANIRKNQWDNLSDYAHVKGTYPGFLVWFYEYNETYFLHIRTLEKILKSGKKSINLEECKKLGILFDGKLKRKYTQYYIIDNLNKIKSSKF